MATKQPRKTIAKPAAAEPAEKIRHLIEQAAYYRAEARGFEPGHELEDWIAAEAEVRRRLENRA